MGHATDEQQLVDRVDALLPRVAEDVAGEVERPAEQVGRALLELLARDLDLGALAVRDDRAAVGVAPGERPLRLLGEQPDGACRVEVGPRVGTRVLFLELLADQVREAGVPVGAAELVVATRRDHPDLVLRHVDDRDVERAAAEVVHEHAAVLAGRGKPVGDRGRGRLVDDVHDVQPCHLARVAGRLALRRAEVRRHRDDDVRERSFRRRIDAEHAERVLHDLLEDERGDGLRVPLLAVDLDGEPSSPMCRLMRSMTRPGSFFSSFLANLPTVTLPVSSKNTTDGVVRSLSWLGRTVARPFSSRCATHE